MEAKQYALWDILGQPKSINILTLTFACAHSEWKVFGVSEVVSTGLPFLALEAQTATQLTKNSASLKS